ncbi:predicted protein [Lichtheimia corymbifera JMRC:FSU:9682]|uniref:Uncharacterized protein n=1 Tax=Lichtheimia corymbifera JMRC:FSU:9682 TaxID=1263082 RepID=A0A068SA04_9FUNG|nr:predicted protein [Lichtheimia corymbifera JMRC:FSU:9682]
MHEQSITRPVRHTSLVEVPPTIHHSQQAFHHPLWSQKKYPRLLSQVDERFIVVVTVIVIYYSDFFIKMLSRCIGKVGLGDIFYSSLHWSDMAAFLFLIFGTPIILEVHQVVSDDDSFRRRTIPLHGCISCAIR